MCAVNFGILRSVAQLLILNIGLYILDYGLDINAYVSQKLKGHHKWANGILLVTFLPNVVGFIYESIKTLSLVQRYGIRKYETFYHRTYDWKEQRIHRIYRYYDARKWKKLSKTNRMLQISVLFLQHFVVALLLLLISIPVMFLIPFLVLALGVLEALRAGIIQMIKQYLNRHLYGWIIGYNRLVDAKTHNATQQNTEDLLFDLFLNNRYN